MKDHVPRHLLEQLVIDDPRAPVRPVLRVHVASCDRCSMRQRALEAARAGYLDKYSASEFVARVLARAARPEPLRRRGFAAWKPGWIMLAAALMLVLPVVVVLWYSGFAAPQQAAESGPLQITLHRGRQVRPLLDGSQLAAGDRLSVSYSLDRPRHLLVLGIDAGGAIRRYFPSDASRPEPLVAAHSAPLPIDLAPDDVRGDEHLFVLVSDTALDEVAVRGTLASAVQRARAQSRRLGSLAELDGYAEQQHVWFRRP